MSEGQTGEEAWLHEKGVSDVLVEQYKSQILDFISNIAFAMWGLPTAPYPASSSTRDHWILIPISLSFSTIIFARSTRLLRHAISNFCKSLFL